MPWTDTKTTSILSATLMFETLEKRRLLTLNLEPMPIIDDAVDVRAPQSVVAADLDADGDDDLLATSFGTQSVEWFENLDGRGDFAEPRPVAERIQEPRRAFAADLDGDHDLDVVVTRHGCCVPGTVIWYPNEGGGKFGRWRGIGQGDVNVALADVDHDGDIDALTAPFGGTAVEVSVSQVLWHENDGTGDFQTHLIAEQKGGKFGTNSIASTDLDGDGDLDVLATTYDEINNGDGTFTGGRIVWYRNVDGRGTFEVAQVVSADFLMSLSTVTGDVDSDGDPDIIASSAASTGGKIVWFENDSRGQFSTERTIDSIAGSQQLLVLDLDGDTDLDLVSTVRDKPNSIGWYENLDGFGSFGPVRPIIEKSEVIRYVSSSDLDDDGDLDLLSASRDDHQIAWYESNLVDDGVVAADINGDKSVNFADFLILSQNFNAIDASFADGDLDGNQVVDLADFLILSTNFGRTLA